MDKSEIVEALTKGKEINGWKFVENYCGITGANALTNEAESTSFSVGAVDNAAEWLLDQYHDLNI